MLGLFCSDYKLGFSIHALEHSTCTVQVKILQGFEQVACVTRPGLWQLQSKATYLICYVMKYEGAGSLVSQKII